MLNAECFSNVESSFDVTNIKEMVLFLLYLIFGIWLAQKVIMNLKNILQINYVTQPVKQVININYLILITLVSQSIQIIIEIIFYLAKLNYNVKQIQKVYIEIYFSFYICQQFKIFILNACILYSSNILFKATQEINEYYERERKRFKYTYTYMIFLIPLLFVYVIIQYLFDCTYPWPRYIIQFLLSVVVFILFLYTITLFRRSVMANPDIPNYFKIKLTRFTVILYLGVLVRTFFYLLQLLDTKLLSNIKQYNLETLTDEGVGWFFFQVFYQPLVNLYPMYFLSQIYSPQGMFHNDNQLSLIHDY